MLLSSKVPTSECGDQAPSATKLAKGRLPCIWRDSFICPELERREGAEERETKGKRSVLLTCA